MPQLLYSFGQLLKLEQSSCGVRLGINQVIMFPPSPLQDHKLRCLITSIVVLANTHKSVVRISSLEVDNQAHDVKSPADHSHLKLICPNTHSSACLFARDKETIFKIF